MKKQIKLIIILAVILCAIIAFDIVIKKVNANKEAEKESKAEAESIANTVHVVDFSDVSSISFGDLTFNKNSDGDWEYSEDAEFPVNSISVDYIVNEMSALTSDRVFEDGDTLENYGLSEPTYNINLSDDQGNKVNIKVGDEVASGDGYYVMKDDDASKIYRCTISTTTYLDYSLLQFMEIDSPSYTWADNATKIVITNNGTDYEFTAEDDNFSDLVDDLDITYTGAAAYKPDENNANAMYGFSNPLYKITITYTGDDDSEQTIVYEIGNEYTDSSYAMRSDSSDNVYTVSSSLISTLSGYITTEE